MTHLKLWGHGKLQEDIALAYAKHDKLGWALGKWSYACWDSAGRTMARLEGSVVECNANEPLAAETFDIEFPVGAHVKRGNSYYLQESDGKLKPITQEEYGAEPPPPRGA
jgi:hypothetical protein